MGPSVDSFPLCSRSLVTKNGILAKRSFSSHFPPNFPEKIEGSKLPLSQRKNPFIHSQWLQILRYQFLLNLNRLCG